MTKHVEVSISKNTRNLNKHNFTIMNFNLPLIQTKMSISFWPEHIVLAKSHKLLFLWRKHLHVNCITGRNYIFTCRDFDVAYLICFLTACLRFSGLEFCLGYLCGEILSRPYHSQLACVNCGVCQVFSLVYGSILDRSHLHFLNKSVRNRQIP